MRWPFQRFDKRITYTGHGKPWSPFRYQEPPEWCDSPARKSLWDALMNTFPIDPTRIALAVSEYEAEWDMHQRTAYE